MASKVGERIYLNFFLEKNNWQNAEVIERESPDFEILYQNEIIGIEVTNLFSDDKGKGSSKRKTESHRYKYIHDIAKKYYSKNKTPLYVSFYFFQNANKIDSDRIVKTLIHVSKHIDEYKDIKIVLFSKLERQVKLFITRIPSDLNNYSIWECINNCGGWVAPITTSLFQTSISKKLAKIKKYKENYNKVILLVVADGMYNSGQVMLDKSFGKIDKGGYHDIYLSLHPKEIIKVTD